MRPSIAVFSPKIEKETILEASFGGFEKAYIYPAPQGLPSQSKHLHLCVKKAIENGHTWMIALSKNEGITENALELLTPSLPLFDAVFGAAVMQDAPTKVMRLTRLAFEKRITLPHALLNWWVPDVFFIKTAVLEKSLNTIEKGEGELWLTSLKLHLWSQAKCMKTAQPLIALANEPQPISPPARAHIRAWLKATILYLDIPYGNTSFLLPYTGQNAGIEREQTRGMFFEQNELLYLKSQIKQCANIVDIGANTGNHTVFFAGVMGAKSVIPFEAIPQTASVLKATIKRNGLNNVDLSKLNVGLASTQGNARVIISEAGGWGATKLVPDVKGKIPIQPLDKVLDTPVDFIKIDVEGLELDVLEGAKRIIADYQPAIFIEITNDNTMQFMQWLEKNAYEIKRIFPDKGHANYFVRPSSRNA